jgi:hypothetical protein
MLLGRILRDLNALLIAAKSPLFCLRLSLSLSSFSVYQGFPLEYINLLTFVSIYVIRGTKTKSLAVHTEAGTKICLVGSSAGTLRIAMRGLS